MRITKHAAKRVRERIGVPARSVVRVAKNALERGAKHCDCTGAMRRYLDRQALVFGRKFNWRVYAQCVWAFTFDGVLITVIPVGKTMKKGVGVCEESIP